jgi:hemerythrin-like metal-binding protein
MPIQWTPELALGIPELDGQHLQLDTHLRLLHDALCEGRVPDVAALLGSVRDASTRHFETEERFMEANGYPRLDHHRDAHRQFTQRLAAFDEVCRREGSTTPLAMELANWLAAWIREHQRHDLELRRYAAPEPTFGGG